MRLNHTAGFSCVQNPVFHKPEVHKAQADPSVLSVRAPLLDKMSLTGMEYLIFECNWNLISEVSVGKLDYVLALWFSFYSG